MTLRWSRRAWFPSGELGSLPTIIRDELLQEEGLVLAGPKDIEKWAQEPLPLLCEGTTVHWGTVAQVVNPEVSWPAKVLWSALEHALSLDPRGSLPLQVYGERPHPDTPRRRGLTYWYAALLHRGWRFPPDVSRARLLQAAAALVESPTVTLARLLTSLAANTDYAQLRLRQLGGQGGTAPQGKASPALPTSPEEAVRQAAREHKVNLVDEKEPLVTYAQLLTGEVQREDLLSLEYQYDPRLPREAYPGALLRQLKDNDAGQEDVFMAGWWSQEGKTSVAWIPKRHRNVLSYGRPGAAVSLTVEEWLQTFRDAGDVIHPLTRTPLPRTVMPKLTWLAQQLPEFAVLQAQVEVLFGLRGHLEQKTLALLTQDLDKTRSELAHYRNLGMAMRGWVEGEPYPQTDIKGSTESLALTSRLLLQVLPDKGESVAPLLLDRPLYLWQRGTYTVPTGPDGATFRARLAAVKAGTACIRVASNSILGAVARYGALIGWHPGYDVTKLPHVA